MGQIFEFVWTLPRRFLALLIRFYQQTLSPDHSWLRRWFPGGYCKFVPSCSQYAHDSVMKYGAIWGSIKAIGRVLRCNPCSRGGRDPA